MTDRFSNLLHEQADRLDVPPPPSQDVLTAGRKLRRRRTFARGGSAVTAVALLSLGIAWTGRVADNGNRLEPAAPDTTAADLGMVFATGSDTGQDFEYRTLYIDGGATTIRLPAPALGLSYTSAGLLVRTGTFPYETPSHFVLVAPDGAMTELDAEIATLPATDPAQPYLAYADMTDGGVDVVVHDVSTDTEVGRVTIEGRPALSTNTPLIYLEGDTVYVEERPAFMGDDVRRTLAVDWRTGDVHPTEHYVPGLSMAAGGRTATTCEVTFEEPMPDDCPLDVIDVATGDSLLTVNGLGAPDPVLSPDGRHVMAVDALVHDAFEVYDVDSGSHVTFEESSRDYGWTASGDLFSVDRKGVHLCDADTGACTTDPLPAGEDSKDFRFLLMGGT